jgi:hypothetical protein
LDSEACISRLKECIHSKYFQLHFNSDEAVQKRIGPKSKIFLVWALMEFKNLPLLEDENNLWLLRELEWVILDIFPDV